MTSIRNTNSAQDIFNRDSDYVNHPQYEVSETITWDREWYDVEDFLASDDAKNTGYVMTSTDRQLRRMASEGNFIMAFSRKSPGYDTLRDKFIVYRFRDSLDTYAVMGYSGASCISSSPAQLGELDLEKKEYRKLKLSVAKGDTLDDWIKRHDSCNSAREKFKLIDGQTYSLIVND